MKNVSIEGGYAIIKEVLAHGRLKEHKTSQGKRKIQLHPKAIEALIGQRNLADKCDFVFTDPKSGQRRASDQTFRKRAWIPVLEKAQVKYRECYQMRHTFAFQMLSSSINPAWLAHHLEHSDWGRIRKTYGPWVNQY